MRRLAARRSEEGSIALVMVIMMVASSLILALMTTTEVSLRSSRRAGDSANALQLADAGLNDAVRAVGTTAQTSIDSGTVALGSAGSYRYTANLDPSATIWHVSATGTDSTGVKRTVSADAVAESLYGSALFVQSTLSIPAGGTLDSFLDGTTKARMCSKHGLVGTNSGASLSFNTHGSANCQNWAYGNAWPSPVDGCISYADTNPPMPSTAAGQCPASNTTLQTPAFTPPQVVSPGTTPTAPIACNSSTAPLVAPVDGSPYYWTSVTLRPGCRIDPTNGPVTIYTAGAVDIGDANGNSGTVNAPYPVAGMCSASTYTPGLQDVNNNPSSFYCPGWSGKLRIYMLTGSNSTIILRNHVQFWGVIDAPTGCLACVGASGNSGSPHSEVWGAIISGTSNSQAQISLHYDEALADLATGRFTLKNWREEKSG